MSSILITFNSDPVTTKTLSFDRANFAPPANLVTLIETFKNLPRSASYLIEILDETITPGETSAIEFTKYFNIDYGYSGLYTAILVDVNKVLISTDDPNAQFGFYNFACDFATAVIDNGTETYLEVEAAVFAEAVNPCDNVELSLLTNVLATVVKDNGIEIVNPNAANPFIVDVVRELPHIYTLKDADNNEITYPSNISVPIWIPKLYAANVNISISPGLAGNTVNINISLGNTYVANPALVFEYSLNDIDWQSENIFTGQAEGDYTMYIRDQFGCKVSKAYTVTNVGTREPFLFMSRANAISFAEYQEWDNCVVHKNDENTLAHQSLSRKNYCLPHLVQKCDKTNLQLKSNFETVSLELRKEDETSEAIPLTKKSSNLSRFKSMDAWMYNYGNGYTGLYFLSGDTYDEADLVNGDYELGGNVPEFAIIGGIIEVVGVGSFFIADVTFDNTIQKKVILFSNTYTGAPVQHVVKSIYDLLPYEVYEATIDWSAKDIGLYDLLLTNDDPEHGIVQHVSENIDLQVKHDETLFLKWSNNNNKDIFYKYGLEHTARIPYLDIYAAISDEVEANETDLSVYLISSLLSDGNVIEFDALPRNMALTLAIALSCENLFINDEGYVKKESLKIEVVEGTNLIEISATLFKTNENYNINRQGQVGADQGYVEFNVPAFIGLDTNLLKL